MPEAHEIISVFLKYVSSYLTSAKIRFFSNKNMTFISKGMKLKINYLLFLIIINYKCVLIFL